MTCGTSPLGETLERLALDAWRTLKRRPWLTAAAALYALACGDMPLLWARSLGAVAPPAALAAAGAALMAVAAALWAEAALADDGGWDGARAATAVAPFMTFFLVVGLARPTLGPLLSGALDGLDPNNSMGGGYVRTLLYATPEVMALYAGAAAACALRRSRTGVLDAMTRGLATVADDPGFFLICLAGAIFLRDIAFTLVVYLSRLLPPQSVSGSLVFVILLQTAAQTMALAAAVAVPVHAVRQRLVDGA